MVTNVEGSPDSTTYLMLTGTRKCVDITKTTWVGAYMMFYDDDSATNCFRHLGDNLSLLN